MKIYKIFIAVALMGFALSCKKNDPIADLGKSNGAYRPELRVSLSTRTLKVGDTVSVTSTVWEKNDKIEKVEYLHKLYENFGIYLELQSTKLETWSADAPKMVVTDTIANDAFVSFPEDGKVLDNYYVTDNNAYVMSAVYKDFIGTEGKYEMEGAALLNALPEEPYKILLNQLSYVITVAEYSTFFPEAPDADFVKTGAVRTALSETGKANLRNNLTKDLFVAKGFKSLKKQGVLHATITVRAVAQSGAVSQVVNEFEAAYQ